MPCCLLRQGSPPSESKSPEESESSEPKTFTRTASEGLLGLLGRLRLGLKTTARRQRLWKWEGYTKCLFLLGFLMNCWMRGLLGNLKQDNSYEKGMNRLLDSYGSWEQQAGLDSWAKSKALNPEARQLRPICGFLLRQLKAAYFGENCTNLLTTFWYFVSHFSCNGEVLAVVHCPCPVETRWSEM